MAKPKVKKIKYSGVSRFLVNENWNPDTLNLGETHETHENTGEGGNTITPSKPYKCRKWCLTINNYTEELYENIKTHETHELLNYIVGKEITKKGTPHLQCWFEWKNGKTFEQVKLKYPTAHIEPARGSIEQNLEYCSKESNYITNKFIERPTVIDRISLYDWQYEILEIIENHKPNDRTVYWYYDPIGNSGKSALAKFLFHNKLAEVIKSAKANDIKNILLMNKKSRDIVIDISRSQGNHISYTVIEELKDGFIYSGKYEGGCKTITTPHVFIFSNELPDITKLSEDRWVIKKLDDGKVSDITEETIRVMKM